ncbi:Poly(3-hydroxybutyrate) depolymerase [Neisseria zoodegmatis]|uniref:Poly(3-hydroxybutyrate) depolymerase n=1 Tax=Neisseria zoodegmatis TaxID=326523 RepID=A0A378WSZ6_9NEIS|nr:PHB depolymerase family esterase [Neisseria zoodegmatis]SUA44269.1 Poly(3-hydroxybutyrate) depolymerase [Neisseria zoodegmatis]
MKKITTALAAAGCAAVLSGCQMMSAQTKPATTITTADSVKDVTAVTEVFSDGQKITAAVVHYDQAVSNESLDTEDFAVAGRTVTKVYGNDAPVTASDAKDGKFVVVELSKNDEDAVAFGVEGRDIIRRRPELKVTQTGDVAGTTGQTIIPDGKERESKEAVNLVVDDFKQAQFADPQTGISLNYNLFVPKNYDPKKAYPLVLFIHDAGVTGKDVKNTLRQGLGAVVWATPEEQAKHEAFVLAPQFDRKIADDKSQTTQDLDAVINLIKHLHTQYNIDPARRYATGQSGGGMMEMAMNIKYPDFFAASFIVAAQWDAAKVAPMAKNKVWIVVSEGDEKAYPGMNAVTAALEKHGAKVARKTWSGLADAAEFDAEVKAMRSRNANINYTVLQKGTVVPAGQTDNTGANHVNTWRIAYTVEGIRDWLFEQRKP